MAVRTVFYSFHYDRDVNRVQLIRNMNVLQGQPLLEPQAWETVKRGGKQAVANWIDKEMRKQDAVAVLIGRETASRDWVYHEIEKARALRKPLVGIYIHGLANFNSAADLQGENPFNKVPGGTSIPVFDPTEKDWRRTIDTRKTHVTLAKNLQSWVGQSRRLW